MTIRRLETEYSDQEEYPFLLRRSGKKKSLIFIHIPKTGGTSIHHALGLAKPRPQEGVRKHYVASEIRRFLPAEIWDNTYKFAFVRNPWERLVSHYFYRIRTGAVEAHEDPIQGFREWTIENIPAKGPGNLQPQYDWLIDEHGDLIIDHIFRFSALKQGFNEVCKANGFYFKRLPHTNKNSREDHYQDYYDEGLKDRVASYYAMDIVKFNYYFR